jgi:hypothetical protein
MKTNPANFRDKEVKLFIEKMGLKPRPLAIAEGGFI